MRVAYGRTARLKLSPRGDTVLSPHRKSLRRIVLFSAWLLLAAPASLYADDGSSDDVFVAVALAIALIVPLQFLAAILLPGFTRRLRRAIGREFYTCAGWGGLVGVLVTTLAVVFGSAGQAGQVVAGAIGGGTVLLAIAGTAGIAKCIGEWAYARWGETASGPVSVLAGSVVWLFGAMVPVIGWLGALLSLFAGLGAAVLVILHPRAYDEQDDERVREEQCPCP